MEMWMMIGIGVAVLLLAYLLFGKKSQQMECVDGVCFPPTPTPQEAEMINQEVSLHPPTNAETMSTASGEMVCEGDKCMMKPKSE